MIDFRGIELRVGYLHQVNDQCRTIANLQTIVAGRSLSDQFILAIATIYVQCRAGTNILVRHTQQRIDRKRTRISRTARCVRNHVVSGRAV